MIRPLTTGVQLLLLLILVGGAAVLWFGRDRVVHNIIEISQPLARALPEPLAKLLPNAQPGSTDAASAGPAASAGKKRKSEARRVPVIVTLVGEARNNETVAAVGTARARRSVMIHAKTDGVIMDFRPRPGDRLSKGDTIFDLDARQAELAVEIANKKVAEARRLLERAQLLKRRNVNSLARVDDAQLAMDQAKLEVLRAEKTLSDLKIVAPFSGVVGLPKAEVGDRVTATTPVVSLDQRDELLVEFVLPEKYAGRVKEGDSISAVTPSYDQRSFAGRIEHIDSRIDPASRTVTIRAVIPNKDDLLRPGMSFAVEIVLDGTMHAMVPELSLQWRKGESYVWLVREHKAVKVLVRSVRRKNSVVLVDGDVRAGDLVVVEGVQRLRDGRGVVYKAPEETPENRTKPGRAATTGDRSKG